MLDRAGFLKANTLLGDLPADTLAELAGRMRDVEVPAGAVLFREGDPGEVAFFVVDGTLRIEKDGIQLTDLSRGECVGEFALIDAGPRSATAVALTPVRLLEWRRADFETALATSPSTAMGVVRGLTGKLRNDVALQVRAGLERARWQHDLERAREIQTAMLPTGDLDLDHIAVSGSCQPAAHVGGDYYDYVEFDGATGLIVADVTGHGFYTGLLVAMARSCLHTQVRIDDSPAAVVQAMNRTVLHSVESRLFMSCCYVRVDPGARMLRYTNAGHPYPFLYRRRADRVMRLESTDIMLGVPGFEPGEFTVCDRPWEPGDLLVLFSDGVPEARSADDEEFGDERLERVILDARDQEPDAVRDRILAAVEAHTRGVTPGDDVTVVVARAR
jgi:CRP-like cAMP-binding protein